MQLTGKRQLAILYIISMTVAFTTSFGDVQIGNTLQLTIGALWIGFALLNIFIGHRGLKKRKELTFFVKLYFVPHVIIHLYTILLMIFGVVSWEYLGTNVTVYIPTLLAIVSVYLFGQKALRYNVVAMIASYLFSTGLAILAHGSHIIIDAFQQAYLGAHVHNYFELHDIVLAAGYVLVYYIATRTGFNRRNIFILFLTLLIMMLGMKRVSIVGLILTISFYFIIKRLADQRKYKICHLGGVVGIFLCYAYIYVIKSGLFDTWINVYNFNTMGRIYYYHAAMNLAEFKVTFPGIGRNVLGEVLNTDYSYLHVGGVHSDLVKMYVENGFIMYGLWLWYYLYHVTKLYKNRYGYKPAVIYFLLTIFMFALYITDNTENYYICQIISILIPMIYAIRCKENEI